LFVVAPQKLFYINAALTAQAGSLHWRFP
jgi:hypothetical protein